MLTKSSFQSFRAVLLLKHAFLQYNEKRCFLYGEKASSVRVTSAGPLGQCAPLKSGDAVLPVVSSNLVFLLNLYPGGLHNLDPGGSVVVIVCFIRVGLESRLVNLWAITVLVSDWLIPGPSRFSFDHIHHTSLDPGGLVVVIVCFIRVGLESRLVNLWAITVQFRSHS